MISVNDVQIIEFPRFTDIRGNLSFAQEGSQVPFDIKRIYWVYDVPGGESRGSHAHKTLEQLMIAVSGSFSVTLDDGTEKKTFFLNRPYQGLYLRPGLWRNLEDFSSGSVVLVLASDLYDENDYIRDYSEFLSFRGIVK